MQDVYHRFLNLIHASKDLLEFTDIEHGEKLLLDALVILWSQQQKVTVLEAMHQVPNISSSTAFRYIKKLRAKGYLAIKIDPKDNRVKYIVATKLLDKYHHQLGKTILKTVHG